MDVTNRILLYGGGGNLVGYYSTAFNYLNKVYGKLKQLIILPHTIYDNDKLLRLFDKKAVLICRERKSYEYVSRFENLGAVMIADDLALSIEPDKLLEGYTKKPDELKILLRHRLKKIIKEGSIKMNPFNAFRYDKEESDIQKPVINSDLSNVVLYDPTMLDPQLVTKNTRVIFSVLSNYSIVNTNRLHICIAAALLGKKVNLYSNSYWKIEEVYKYSLYKRFPNISWKGEVTLE